MSPSYRHVPVMVEEVVDLLRPERGGMFLDGTLGAGGHAERVLDRGREAVLTGIDVDPDALAAAGARLERFGPRARLRRGDFRDVERILEESDSDNELAGALLDLGVSSHQLDEKARGFSFRRSTPLNMRMGGTTGGRRPAADFLNSAPERELGRVFREYGEERRWRAVAREIVRRRKQAPFETSDDLMGALTASLGRGLTASDRARLFQAVRIQVNDELRALEEALPVIRDLLAPGGRLVVIAYHSLEDRIAKRALREWSRRCVCPPELPVCRCRGRPLGRVLTRRPLRPGDDEVQANPRARSARLRAWEKAGEDVEGER